MRIDLDADRLVRAGKQLGDFVNNLQERLAGSLDMAGIGGDAVHIPEFDRVLDFVGFGGVQEKFHGGAAVGSRQLGVGMSMRLDDPAGNGEPAAV